MASSRRSSNNNILLCLLLSLAPITLALRVVVGTALVGRRAVLVGGGGVAAIVASPAVAKTGVGANFGVPDQSEQDAILGSRADTFGDYSRANSVYQQQLKAQLADASLIDARRAALAKAAEKVEKKLAPAVDKAQFPKILDVLNAEMYTFKTLLSDATKATQGGKVCLVDVSQRGATMPKGFDPDDCPVQLVQTAILQDINDLSRAATTRDTKRADLAYRAFAGHVDAFLDKVATLSSAQ